MEIFRAITLPKEGDLNVSNNATIGNNVEVGKNIKAKETFLLMVMILMIFQKDGMESRLRTWDVVASTELLLF